MAVSIRPVALYVRETHAPERTAGNNEHAGGRGAKTIYKIRWYGLGGEESSSTAIIQALSPVGETVPSRRHNQTDSESGKEANEADTEVVLVSPFFVPILFVGVAQW